MDEPTQDPIAEWIYGLRLIRTCKCLNVSVEFQMDARHTSDHVIQVCQILSGAVDLARPTFPTVKFRFPVVYVFLQNK